MTEERQEPYTEREFSELAKKLKALGNNLSPKENAFLTDVLDNAVKAAKGSEVQAFGMKYDEQGYSPAKGPGGQAMSFPTIAIKVKGTFVEK
ncbi:MAG: hypothetical protein ACXVZJ_09755 [Terriglobales bacterium]